MCKFNEDEIIKYANDIINATFIEATLQDKDGNIIEQGLVNKDVIKGLLDLYQKEKEKNQELFNEYNKRVATIIKYEQGIKYFLDETNISDIEPCNVYTIGGNLLFELEELLEE